MWLAHQRAANGGQAAGPPPSASSVSGTAAETPSSNGEGVGPPYSFPLPTTASPASQDRQGLAGYEAAPLAAAAGELQESGASEGPDSRSATEATSVRVLSFGAEPAHLAHPEEEEDEDSESAASREPPSTVHSEDEGEPVQSTISTITAQQPDDAPTHRSITAQLPGDAPALSTISARLASWPPAHSGGRQHSEVVLPEPAPRVPLSPTRGLRSGWAPGLPSPAAGLPPASGAREALPSVSAPAQAAAPASAPRSAGASAAAPSPRGAGAAQIVDAAELHALLELHRGEMRTDKEQFRAEFEAGQVRITVQGIGP